MELDKTPIEVFVPTPESVAEKLIAPKSGIVASIKGQTIEADYEGNLHGASNIETYADRVHHAWGRHSSRYPTAARSWFEPGELRMVGLYLPERGEVELEDQEAAVALADWLSVDEVPGEELLAGGSEFYEMRAVERMLSSGDPEQMMKAKMFMRSRNKPLI